MDSDSDSKPKGYIVLCRTYSHFTDSNSDPYSLFLYRTGIRVRVRTRVDLWQCKWAIWSTNKKNFVGTNLCRCRRPSFLWIGSDLRLFLRLLVSQRLLRHHQTEVQFRFVLPIFLLVYKKRVDFLQGVPVTTSKKIQRELLIVSNARCNPNL